VEATAKHLASPTGVWVIGLEQNPGKSLGRFDFRTITLASEGSNQKGALKIHSRDFLRGRVMSMFR
jgi:hypothetical protein